MFSQASFILFTGRVCIQACTVADTPLDRHIQHALGQTPPWADIYQHALGQTYPNMHWGRHPPPPMGTAVDITHPTGMHSCFKHCYQLKFYK